MKRPSIYVDTSVLGGCFEPEFAEWSKGLVVDFKSGAFVPIFSTVLAAEIARAPAIVRGVYDELIPYCGRLIEVDDEALTLLGAYEARGILGPRFRADMLHIALAVVARADLLVSWNFKHIVRFDKIRAFNAANLEQGYGPLAIYSPREVTTHGRDPIEGA